MSGEIRVEVDDRVATLLFDHKARRNAITVHMWESIPDAVARVQADPAVRVVIMRGAGVDAFVSGADISEFEKVRTGNAGRDYDKMTSRAFNALRDLDKPLIASIHGYCVGGGAALALTADIRHAADDAVFAVPPARLGLGYHMEGIEALHRTVGFSNTSDLLFTGRQVSADQALRMGLVNAVHDKAELDKATTKLATRIARNAPLTIRAAKITQQELAKLETARDAERIAAAIEQCYQSDDFEEGVRAFLEKRKPQFEGK